MNMFHLRKGTETMIEFYKRCVLKILVLTVLGLVLPISIFSQDTSCGIIWYPAIQLSDDTISSVLPRIAVSGDDTVHVTWTTNSADYTIMKLPYTKIVSGNIIETRDLLKDSIAFPYRTFSPVILAWHERVWIFFTGATESFPPIRMITSTNGGNDWTSVRDVSTDRVGKLYSAANNESRILLVYPPHISGGKDELPKILRSTNYGETWTRTNEDLNYYAKIALTQNSLHLVLHKWIPPSVEIEYRRSSNLGDTWEIDTVLSEVDGYWSDLPTIAGYSNKCDTELLTAWRDTKHGWFCIFGASIISRAGLHNGGLWLPEKVITPEPKGSEPQAAMNSNIRAVEWMYEKTCGDTLQQAVSVTNNSPTPCCSVTDLTRDAEDAIDGAIAVSDRAVHIVWEQEDNNGNFRIFYRRGEFIPKDVNFSLSTGFLEIDTTEIGRTKTDTIRVANTGSDTMIIGTAISDNETFTVTPYDTTVAPFSETVFKVSFTPKRYGKHSGKIIFYHNGQSSPDCFDVTGTATWRKETISYRQGEWNMVSIPMKPGPAQSLPSMFSYEGSYIPRDTILFGKGYWSKPAAEVDYYGVDIWSDTFAVKSGWNMIGSLTGEVLRSDITTIPENIITSLFYIFDGEKYVPADTLKPGRSYWIKVKQDGKLILK